MRCALRKGWAGSWRCSVLGDGWDWRLGAFKGKRRAFFVIQWFTGVMAPASTLEGGMRVTRGKTHVATMGERAERLESGRPLPNICEQENRFLFLKDLKSIPSPLHISHHFQQ